MQLRRCKIAKILVEKNFDLAFQVIYEFNLPAVDIYAGVAASLAERKRGSQLTEFFKNIKGTIDDDDWDQFLYASCADISSLCVSASRPNFWRVVLRASL
ncbi:hypothetical protein K1719_044306 [Acacia pycnantha]|nr:hypothetical protein K1719_044306 [Acacia pycnantha]